MCHFSDNQYWHLKARLIEHLSVNYDNLCDKDHSKITIVRESLILDVYLINKRGLVTAYAGYVVYKSVPMGTLSQVLPYLARRAAENRSVLHGARKERELLQQELRWRLRSLFQRWATLERKQRHDSWFNFLL